MSIRRCGVGCLRYGLRKHYRVARAPAQARLVAPGGHKYLLDRNFGSLRFVGRPSSAILGDAAIQKSVSATSTPAAPDVIGKCLG